MASRRKLRVVAHQVARLPYQHVYGVLSNLFRSTKVPALCAPLVRRAGVIQPSAGFLLHAFQNLRSLLCVAQERLEERRHVVLHLLVHAAIVVILLDGQVLNQIMEQG